MRRATAGLARAVTIGATVVGLVACGRIGGTRTPPTTARAQRLVPNAVLVRVVDGDTIDVQVNNTDERVRLIGIDTPETKKPNTPVQCYGHEASAFTTSLLPVGTQLYLERDAEARDVYGRLLAYVYRSADGLFVNDEIIRKGYARLLTIPPDVAHADDFVDANKAARADDIGLWANCTG
jgi:micrococcal nuclease